MKAIIEESKRASNPDAFVSDVLGQLASDAFDTRKRLCRRSELRGALSAILYDGAKFTSANCHDAGIRRISGMAYAMIRSGKSLGVIRKRITQDIEAGFFDAR